MGQVFKKIAFIAAIIIMAVFFVRASSNGIALQPKSYKMMGSSNGSFFSGGVVVKVVDPFSMSIGQFPLYRKLGALEVHPIIEVIRLNGKIVGYYTKGIENEVEGDIILPFEIEGRVFRLLESGEAEEDTKYMTTSH